MTAKNPQPAGKRVTPGEARKRVPKPPMSESTRWLIEKALPVFDRFSEDWGLEEAWEATDELRSVFDAETPLEYSRLPHILESIKWGKAFLREVLLALRMDRKACKTAREIAEFHRMLGGSVGKEMLVEANRVIAEAFPKGFDFSTRGWTRVLLAPKGITNITDDFFKAVIADHVLKAFNVETGENGLYYIGICPRCGKVFKKQRGDQDYCSRGCGGAERKDKSRARRS